MAIDPTSLTTNIQTDKLGQMASSWLGVAGIIFTFLFIAAIFVGAVMIFSRINRFKIRVNIRTKNQNGWSLTTDKAGLIKEKDKSGEKVEKLKLLKRNIVLPPYPTDVYEFQQGFFGSKKILNLAWYGGLDYRPILIREASDAAFTVQMDNDTWTWMSNELVNDARTFLQKSGFGEFLRTYGPFIATGMLFAMLFVFWLISSNDLKAIVSGLHNVASVLKEATAPTVAAAP